MSATSDIDYEEISNRLIALSHSEPDGPMQQCGEFSPKLYRCTRSHGHTGYHVARGVGGLLIYARWLA